jgi:glycosyltransferase involved in cell wall biosynthesis
MRIAFLGPSYPWRGGIAQFAENLAAKLENRGHEILMFTFIHQYPELLFPGSDQIDNSKREYKLATHKVLTPYNPFTWLSAARDIQAWQPDLLIVSYWIPFLAPALGYIMRKLKSTKRLFLIHNLDFHEKWLGADKLTRYALQAADYYVTLSGTSSKALTLLLKPDPEKQSLQLFHPLYEFLRLPEQTNHELKHKLLFFGFVKHYKGLDILFRAMPKVLQKLPELKLVVAGDVYGDKKVYLDLVNELKLKDKVELHLRYIGEEEIEQFFEDCDVCILPYRSATQSGVALLSFSFDVTVIASRVGGMEEAVIDNVNGYLVEPENPETLADRIVALYQGDTIYRFRKNIKETRQNLSWDNFTDQLLEFLK